MNNNVNNNTNNNVGNNMNNYSNNAMNNNISNMNNYTTSNMNNNISNMNNYSNNTMNNNISNMNNYSNNTMNNNISNMNNYSNNTMNNNISNMNNYTTSNMNNNISNNANNYVNNNSVSPQNNTSSNDDCGVSKIEELRLIAKNKFTNSLILFSLIAIVIYAYCFRDGGIELGPLVMFLAFAYFGAHIMSIKETREFKNTYKKHFVLSIFKRVCNDVHFDFNNGISRDVIANTKMMYMGDRYSSNDYVTGCYKGVNFEYSDVHIEDERRDSDGDSHYVTIFKGQWFIFDFHKNFKSNIQVCESTFRNAKRGNLFDSFKYKKVELEDIEFNKMFKVYALNDLEAFYILTPHTMQNIKQINSRLSGSLLFCFIDNKLHVGLYNNKDTFEASIFTKVNEEKENGKAFAEVNSIFAFIDILNLDNTLFK